MIKGCHKRIIFLKSTGSELFEEAYFIMKPRATEMKESDVVSEATKIVNSFEERRSFQAKKRGKGRWLIPFLSGTILGSLLVLFILLI